MDMINYLTTTLTVSFNKIGPVLGFLILSYVLFIRLPFLFYVKVMTNKAGSTLPPKLEDNYDIRNYQTFLDSQRRSEPDDEKLNQKNKTSSQSSEKNHSGKTKAEESKEEQSSKKKENKIESPKQKSRSMTAESLFEFSPGQLYSKKELKQKYHELLKMNHPDKVATLGVDFKILAEKKTKAINSAYEKLKSRVS